jgi:hypothetical protein
VITADVLLDRSTAVLLEALENTLGQKVGKLAREGGELRFTFPSGVAITFNVLEATMDRTFDIADVAKFRARYTLAFVCEPFGLGTEVDMGDNTETTLPVLIFTETGILGDVPALGRLVIDDDSAVSQWWLTWGIESRYYSSSANAALFYEAEGRTALGGSATVVGPSGASGGGSNVMRNTALQTGYLAILSTQATGAGAQFSHVGTFRIYARVQIPTTNTGEVTVALEWSEGDFLRATTNSPTTISTAHEGQWRLVDLGLVSLRQALSGTQRWEGRIIAKSTVSGDDIDVDYLLLVPVAEGSGIVSGVLRSVSPTSYVGEDHFTSTTAGNALNARVAPTGGTWATSGDATDFTFSDDFSKESLTRAVNSSTNGRFAVLGTTNYTNCIVEAKVMHDFGTGSLVTQQGLIARWTDSSNHLRAVVYRLSSGATTHVEIHELIAGVKTVIASASTTAIGGGAFYENYFKLRLTVTSLGGAKVELFATGEYETPTNVYGGAPGSLIMSAETNRASLATGATLASGEPGIFDYYPTTPTVHRYYDDFLVSNPAEDAAIFASQSIEIRHDRVTREDSTGTVWNTPSSYTGDYLFAPPAGAEGRSARVVIKGSRGDPFELDSSIDDISAKLFVTPRFLVVPDA